MHLLAETAPRERATIMHLLAETAPRERAEREREREGRERENATHGVEREREKKQSTIINLPHLAADGADREGGARERERERNTPPIVCGGRRSFRLMGRRERERERERESSERLAADDTRRERGSRENATLSAL